jgi:hypothetical protein
MKKISVVFALFIMAGFTGGASASILSWDVLPSDAVTTLDNQETISASYGFGLNEGVFSHNYVFSGEGDTHAETWVSGLLNENINFSNLFIDGNAMTFDVANQRWFGSSDLSFAHLLHIEGNVSGIGQQYLVMVGNPNSDDSPPVGAVPVPAAIWLFGSALMGLMGVTSRITGSKALTAA